MDVALTPADSARFWSKVTKGEGCWAWRAHRNAKGYGVFSVSGRNRPAHRVSYASSFGSVARGQMVLHRCDNPPCVRPDHLFLGTGKDNAADCIRKGRFSFRSTPGAAHCQRGHEFTTENTFTERDGKRKCRTCLRARNRARWTPRSKR